MGGSFFVQIPVQLGPRRPTPTTDQMRVLMEDVSDIVSLRLFFVLLAHILIDWLIVPSRSLRETNGWFKDTHNLALSLCDEAKIDLLRLYATV